MKGYRTINELVDPNTGEIVTMTAVAKKRARSPFSSFTMLSLESIGRIGELLCDKELKPNDVKVLFCMFKHMEAENEVDIFASAIVKETGITKQNVYGSIKRLMFANAIIKNKLIGNTQTYKISAQLAWKGPAEGHAAEIHAQAEIKRKERANLRAV